MALVDGSKNKCCSSVLCSSSSQNFLLSVSIFCFQVFMKLGPKAREEISFQKKKSKEEIIDLKQVMVFVGVLTPGSTNE